MSMNLTRRDALRGIAAVSVIPLFPACAFAAPGDRGDSQPPISTMAGSFFGETPQVPASRALTPQLGARLNYPTIGRSKIFPRNPQPTGSRPSGRTAIAPKQSGPLAG
jgi:hypothetical protein